MKRNTAPLLQLNTSHLFGWPWKPLPTKENIFHTIILLFQETDKFTPNFDTEFSRHLSSSLSQLKIAWTYHAFILWYSASRNSIHVFRVHPIAFIIYSHHLVNEPYSSLSLTRPHSTWGGSYAQAVEVPSLLWINENLFYTDPLFLPGGMAASI